MLEEREFDIDWGGRRCRVGQLAAKPSRAVIARLMNIIGNAMKEVSPEHMDASAEFLLGGTALSRIDQPTLDFLTDTFMRVTIVEGEPGDENWIAIKDVEDLVFGGGDGTARWGKWLRFCLELSCGPFFKSALSEAKAAMGAPSKATSPSVSKTPGSSTGSPSPGAIRTH